MDPYAILGVSKTATQTEIRDAYRKLAKKLHPDLNPGNSSAEKEFKEVSSAYEILGDSEKRAKFDQEGLASEISPSWRGPSYYETQENNGRYTQAFEEDLFSHFGDLFAREAARGATRAARERADPLRLYRLEIDFREAVLGTLKRVTLPEGKTIQIRIPPGVEDGQRLHLKGYGELEVLVKPSSFFRRKGKNIEIEVPVSLGEAVLGAEIRVPTVDGAVLLRLPPGSNSGSRFRIQGKGVGSEGSRGDEIVSIQVVLPKQIDPELKKAVTDWSLAHPYNPREELEKVG